MFGTGRCSVLWEQFGLHRLARTGGPRFAWLSVLCLGVLRACGVLICALSCCVTPRMAELFVAPDTFQPGSLAFGGPVYWANPLPRRSVVPRTAELKRLPESRTPGEQPLPTLAEALAEEREEVAIDAADSMGGPRGAQHPGRSAQGNQDTTEAESSDDSGQSDDSDENDENDENNENDENDENDEDNTDNKDNKNAKRDKDDKDDKDDKHDKDDNDNMEDKEDNEDKDNKDAKDAGGRRDADRQSQQAQVVQVPGAAKNLAHPGLTAHSKCRPDQGPGPLVYWLGRCTASATWQSMH